MNVSALNRLSGLEPKSERGVLCTTGAAGLIDGSSPHPPIYRSDAPARAMSGVMSLLQLRALDAKIVKARQLVAEQEWRVRDRRSDDADRSRELLHDLTYWLHNLEAYRENLLWQHLRGVMPLNRLLAKSVFQPDEVTAMAKAFEATCGILGLSRDEPKGQLLARKVIECARTGERDPELLRKLVLSELENYASKKIQHPST
jgi:hypothetical protein